MSRWLYELDHGTKRRRGRIALGQLARIGLAQGGKTLPESMAQTRYSEHELVDVLLLRNLRIDNENKQKTRLAFLDDSTAVIEHQRYALDRQGWRELAALLMSQMVRVPIYDAPVAMDLKYLRKLGFGHCLYLGNPADDEALMRLALVDEAAELKGLDLSQAHPDHTLEYRSDLGYRVIKNRKTHGKTFQPG